jgi:hypothetical protein
VVVIRLTSVISVLLEMLVPLCSQVGLGDRWFLGLVALQWLRGLGRLG